MTLDRKNSLLRVLDEEVIRAKEAAEKADEASKFTISGPSQSGDKYHAIGASEMAKGYLEHLELLRREIEAVSSDINNTAVPVSYVEIQYQDISKLGFFLVKNAASLTQYLFISDISPLGKAILGKKEGESFSYELDEAGNKRSFSGVILKIE